jgi:hypothetical protein
MQLADRAGGNYRERQLSVQRKLLSHAKDE